MVPTKKGSKSRKNVKNKEVKNPYDGDNAFQPIHHISKPLLIGNQEIVPTPHVSAEQQAIYASQVIIILTLVDKILGYMGPMLSSGCLE